MMTSSPGPTPRACRARCSAVVQLETAQAWRAPTQAANSSSNAATSGPWVIQPERIARRAASASSSPSVGRAIGIFRKHVLMTPEPQVERSLRAAIPPAAAVPPRGEPWRRSPARHGPAGRRPAGEEPD